MDDAITELITRLQLLRNAATQGEVYALRHPASSGVLEEYMTLTHNMWPEQTRGLHYGEYVGDYRGPFAKTDAELDAANRKAVPLLIEEIKRLRETLEFYADISSYRGSRYGDPDIFIDEGKLAREALIPSDKKADEDTR